MSETKSEIAVKTTQDMSVQSISPIVKMAMDKDLDPAKLEKLLEVQVQYERREAEKAFHTAMANFKKAAPVVNKNVEVSYSTSKGITRYNHCSLGYITGVVMPVLSDYGLSLTWGLQQKEKEIISVTARVTHAMGHAEQTTLQAAPDQSGGKNSIQAIGSTITYLRRITGMSLLGLAEADGDTDGIVEELTDEEMIPISEVQATALLSLIKDIGRSEGQLVKFINMKKQLELAGIAELPSSMYDGVVSLLNGMKK